LESIGNRRVIDKKMKTRGILYVGTDRVATAFISGDSARPRKFVIWISA